MQVYLDTCIVIYLIEAVEPWYARLVSAMNAGSRLEFLITDLVRMECLVKPLRDNGMPILREYERYFTDSSFLPLTTAVFDRAAELRAHDNLRTPDGVHLAAALTHRCDEFWTNDARLSGVSGDLRVRNFGAD